MGRNICGNSHIQAAHEAVGCRVGLVRPFNAGNYCHAEGNRSVCRDCIGHGVVHREGPCHPSDSWQFRRPGGCRPTKSLSSRAAMLTASWAICDAGHRLAKMARGPRQGIRRQQWRCPLLRSRGERLLLQRILFVLGAGHAGDLGAKTKGATILSPVWPDHGQGSVCWQKPCPMLI
jgi:hypothetical protein